jgi:hypothetical protein
MKPEVVWGWEYTGPRVEFSEFQWNGYADLEKLGAKQCPMLVLVHWAVVGEGKVLIEISAEARVEIGKATFWKDLKGVCSDEQWQAIEQESGKRVEQLLTKERS